MLFGKSNSQPRSGQLTFGLIKVEIIDTSKFKLSDIEPSVKVRSKPYEYELYFSPKYILVIKEDEGLTLKKLYDRKKQVYYVSWHYEDETTIKEDSIRGLIFPLADYISRIDSVKNIVGRINYPNKRKNIFGFDCYEVLYPNQNGGITADSKVYITENIIVPSMLFDGPLSEKYLVMEYWQSAANCTWIFGATKIIPNKINKRVFKWDLRRFKLVESN